MSYYLHPGYTGLLAVSYNPQVCSHLLFVLSLYHQLFIYMTAFFTSFRSLLKENFTSEDFSDPFKKYSSHSIPYSCPSSFSPFPSLLFFILFTNFWHIMHLLIFCQSHPIWKNAPWGQAFCVVHSLAWMTNSRYSIYYDRVGKYTKMWMKSCPNGFMWVPSQLRSQLSLSGLY